MTSNPERNAAITTMIEARAYVLPLMTSGNRINSVSIAHVISHESPQPSAQPIGIASAASSA
jgi:hypothetical protein